jgi:Xaa-Pro aminopeptidase
MFDSKVYAQRRDQLRSIPGSGVALFPGNNDSPMNYRDNPYHFRQDSSFLYFFGLDQPGLAGIVDLESGQDILFGDDLTLDDIIWMGEQPSVKERALQAGVTGTGTLNELATYLSGCREKGRKVHYLPTYRAETATQLESLLDIHHLQVAKEVSVDLIKAVVALRSVKDEHEIKDIEDAVDVAYEMHTAVMRMARPGIYERELAGALEGIALSHGRPVSFPVILSMDGQTLHNHYHGNLLTAGRMLVTDAGTESVNGLASDITRTIPVSGTFNPRQREIYEIVLKANQETISAVKPGIMNKSLHMMASRIIAGGLKELGLMKGDTEEAVNQGAHALFMPHGLGHMMGLDVHDMEGLGEDYVGYDDEVQRIKQFGTAYLRLARKLQEGFVFTIEPGIYFIPALIDLWKSENRFNGFINYEKVEAYKDFGGIRIEDDILVTADGYRVLGKPIPKTVEEVEDEMKKS